MKKLATGVCISISLSAIVYLMHKLRQKRITKNSLADLVGNTPLIYLKSLSQRIGRDVYAKCEFMNPCGSMKDRTALAMIKTARKKTLYEGTSGSTGISLTQIGNSMGYKTKVYLPDDLAQEKYRLLELLGAKLEKVRPCSIVDENHFCRIAEKQSIAESGHYCDQFNTIANFNAHLKTGEEIYQQTNGTVDCFVMSAGTGGAIAGVSSYLKSKRSVRVVLADPPGSSLANHVNYGVCYTDQEAEGHRKRHPFDSIIEGVGLNRLTGNYSRALIDSAFTISDQESLDMSQILIREEGLFVGGSSAMNCAAVLKAAQKYPECKVFVTVLCDSGMRYISKFYNPEFKIQ